jgi:hypothetical protein
MAGDWMKVEKDTPEKPEILAIASALGINPEEAFGRCFKVWRWADSHTVDGCARVALLCVLDAIAGMPGFSQALLDVGWLQTRSGSFVIPHFDRHMGQSGKQRALAAERMARSRGKKRDDCGATKAPPEKRRGEKRRDKTEPPLPPLPSSLDTPAFREKWDEWLAYKKSRRETPQPATQQRQLRQFEEWGIERAIAAIDFTILKGWQGLVEPNERGRASGETPQQRLARVKKEMPPCPNGLRNGLPATQLPSDSIRTAI